MTTRLFAIGLVLVCSLFASFGQIFVKKGSETALLNHSLLTNYNLIFGLFLYGIGGFLLIIALKYGELSVLYPVFATSYILVAIFSTIFLNETMNTMKWVGIFVIILGVTSIGVGSKK